MAHQGVAGPRTLAPDRLHRATILTRQGQGLVRAGAYLPGSLAMPREPSGPGSRTRTRAGGPSSGSRERLAPERLREEAVHGGMR